MSTEVDDDVTEVAETLPYPARRDDIGPHPAYDDDHTVEQTWVHYGRQYDEHVEYDHSEPLVSIVDDSGLILKSDMTVNLEKQR